MRKDDRAVEEANKGDIISFPTNERVRKNDKVYKWIKVN